MIDLSPFCSKDPLRFNINQPWSRGDYTYATNGHILIRTPRSSDVPDNEKAPNAEKILTMVAGQTETAALPQFAIPEREEKNECEICDGRGSEHDCPDCAHECVECEGTGIVKYKISVGINGAFYDLKYIQLIMALPNAAFSVRPPVDAPARYVFGESGEGALMPIRGTFARHIQMLWQPRFPFFSHRTMEEVAETERLAILRSAGKLRSEDANRFDGLLYRADVNNPPTHPAPDDGA